MENYKIWRYLDFTKFISMLEMKSLFLCRVDLMIDEFEGSYPTEYFKDPAKMYGMHSNTDLRQKLRKHVAVNCWHRSEYESAAMWSLYLKSDEGVAICTHVEQLTTQLFRQTLQGYLPAVVPVKYIDFDNDRPQIGFLGAFSLKRKSFEHEKEVRALLCKCDKEWDISDIDEIDESGINVPIDINRLIEEIYVSPTAPKWFYDLVLTTSKRYGLECEVIQSSLHAGSPVY